MPRTRFTPEISRKRFPTGPTAIPGQGNITSDSFTKSFEPSNAPVDELAKKKKWMIEFQHLPSSEGVWFHAFITQMGDTFQSNWQDEEVFGRMDPIAIFKNTRRSISLSWDVPAVSETQAKENISTINRFVQMLYPMYTQTQTTQEFVNGANKLLRKKNGVSLPLNQIKNILNTVSNFEKNKSKANHMISPPLLKMKFVNLFSNASGKQKSSIIQSGLVVKVDGALTIQPDMEAGFFGTEPGMLYPQVWKLSCNLTPLHTHTMGWKEIVEVTEIVEATNTNSIVFGDNLSGNGNRHLDSNFPYPVIGIPRENT